MSFSNSDQAVPRQSGPFRPPAYTRYEEDLLFDWGEDAPGPWVQPDGFSERYAGAFYVGFPLGRWYKSFYRKVSGR